MKIEAEKYLQACRIVQQMNAGSRATTVRDMTRECMAVVGQLHGALNQMHKGRPPEDVNLVFVVRQLIRCAADWQIASGMDFLRTHRMQSVDMLSANIGRCASTNANPSTYLMGLAERVLEIHLPHKTVSDLMEMDIRQVLELQHKQALREARVEAQMETRVGAC
jgi:hypothetical protein